MKKTISLIIVITILLSLGAQTMAATNDKISPMYIHLMTLSAYVEIDESGLARCTSNLTQGLSDGTSELIMKLQKLNSYDKWETIATWTKEGTMKCTNVTYRQVSEGTYRLSTTGVVYDKSGEFIESDTVNSISKTY